MIGSSPRVRGKRGGISPIVIVCGLIPACAGKTAELERCLANRSAHPRVCGENNLQEGSHHLVWGSSPRVRGKLIRTSCCCGRGGLIPACAGKTSSYAQTASGTRAHPRVCGENLESQSDKVHDAGSSPRVRGKLNYGNVRTFVAGLIPACEGKTLGKLAISPRNGAHPRVCGENWDST